MSDSKNGSKTQLNESNMPLLDEQEKKTEVGSKEAVGIEMKEGLKTEDDKVATETKSRVNKGPGTLDRFSVGLDLLRRDDKAINNDVNLDFNDVLAEPDSAQSLDIVWKLSFVLFSKIRLWLYRIVAAIVAVPLAIVWGVVFALLTAVYVWIVAPALRVFELFVLVARRVVNGLLRFTLEPVATAAGAVFARIPDRNPTLVQRV